MNNFTLENTKDAAGYSLYCRNINFYKEVTNDGFLLFNNFSNGWSQEIGAPTLAVIPLLRPHNETRDHWTTNGVTQYAQPQGNKMDTSKLIPISYVKKITPLVVGDVLFNSRDGVKFTLTQNVQVDVFNSGVGYVEGNSDDLFFVMSFADRPNEGVQPVGDDVVVDITTQNNCMYDKRTAATYPSWWSEGTIKTWKPNHDAMLESYLQSQVDKSMNDIDWIHGSEYYKTSTQEFFRMPDHGSYAEYYSHHYQAWKVHASVPVSNLTRSYFIKRLELPSCDSQENMGPGVELSSDYENSDAHRIRGIGDILHNMSCSMTDDSEQSEFGDYASFCWDMGDKLSNSTLSVKPTFTQAQADAGELPAVGCDVVIRYMHDSKTVTHAGNVMFASNRYVILMMGSHEHCFKIGDYRYEPIQTAEQKLLDAIALSITSGALIVTDKNAKILAAELMDKFNLTLKG